MKRTEWVLNLAMALLVVCAVTVTVLVVRREFFPPRQEQTVQGAPVADWQSYSRAGRRLGRADAPVTLVVFSDYQCPYCRVQADQLRTLRQSYPDDISVVYRHFPLPSHPHAVAAARASECAGLQHRFEEYHNALFARQESIGMFPWADFAKSAGIPDRDAFLQCIQSPPVAVAAAVDRDLRAGQRLEVSGTPTLLINGRRFQGAVPWDTLTAHVQRALGATVSRDSAFSPYSLR